MVASFYGSQLRLAEVRAITCLGLKFAYFSPEILGCRRSLQRLEFCQSANACCNPFDPHLPAIP